MTSTDQYIVVQHEDCTTPGSTLSWLKENQRNYRVIRPDLGDIFPEVSSSLKIIICGGIPNVDQEADFPWLKIEKKWLRELIKNEIPILGLCLGAQLMADALGASVYKAKDWEYGWQPIKISEDFSQWMGGEIGSLRHVFQCHRYQFDLPQSVKPFGQSEPTPFQGFFKDRKMLAVQFHPEADQNWINLCVDASKPKGPYCELVSDIPTSTAKYLLENQKWYFSMLNRFFLR